MDYKHLIAGALAFSLAACAAGCSDKSSSSGSSSETTTSTSADTTTASSETTTENTTGTSEATTEKPEPPKPTEASDPNTITFDDGDFSFAEPIIVDTDSAKGTLSVVEVQGNKMLKFTDDMTAPQHEKVQKIAIHAASLVAPENIGKVRSIEFDVYADALEANYQNLAGEFIQVPGTICCGGGTVTAAKDSEGKNKWYNFGEFEGGEYNFDFSGAVHGTFKFLLADAGQCWDAEMEDPNFLIMRWGVENDSNFYIDNIVFYDEEGKSIPLAKKPAETDPGSDEVTVVSEEELPDGSKKITYSNGETIIIASGNSGNSNDEPTIVSEEELPDGGKKVTYSNGEVHVMDKDGVEDLDQYVPGTETETQTTTENKGNIFDEDGNNIL